MHVREQMNQHIFNIKGSKLEQNVEQQQRHRDND